MNCIKNHSIILSVTCHGLRNFPSLIHIPSKPFVKICLKPYEWGGVGHAWVGWGGVGHTGVGWVGYGVKQPKNDSPQNQDLTQPKSFLEGVQNPSFEYKNSFIIILLL